MVTADEQRAGRGRQGRTWSAPAGGALLYSVILRPLEERHLLLPLAVPLAVCEAVEGISSHQCQVKWPNDVWINGRKCAGVLIEARPQDGWAVIGVGLNISIEPGDFPEELRDSAISVGGEATVAEALGFLNSTLAGWTQAEPEQVLAAFRDRDALLGREIGWTSAAVGTERAAAGVAEHAGAATGSGVAEGIDERGNLIVATDGGERASLGSGEVHLRRVKR